MVNFRGGAEWPRSHIPWEDEPEPFRSHFPIRYYLHDFEIGLVFDEGSDPSSRTTTGFPTTVSGRKGTYGRHPAPEMLKQGERYCPFRLDVWQAGMMMKEKCRFEVCDKRLFIPTHEELPHSSCSPRFRILWS